MTAKTKIILAALAMAPVSAQAATFIDRASFTLAVPGAAIVEDFESAGPVNTAIPSLVTPSATYIGQAGVPFANVYVIDPSATNFALGGAPIGSKVLTANGDESFLINLASATQAVGFDLFLNDLGVTTVRFFAGATQVDQIIFTADASIANNRSFAGIVSASAISAITFVSTAGGQLNTGLDNLTVGRVAPGVPEPASWAMMIGGLGIVGAAIRRSAKRIAFA